MAFDQHLTKLEPPPAGLLRSPRRTRSGGYRKPSTDAQTMIDIVDVDELTFMVLDPGPEPLLVDSNLGALLHYDCFIALLKPPNPPDAPAPSSAGSGRR